MRLRPRWRDWSREDRWGRAPDAVRCPPEIRWTRSLWLLASEIQKARADGKGGSLRRCDSLRGIGQHLGDHPFHVVLGLVSQVVSGPVDVERVLAGAGAGVGLDGDVGPGDEATNDGGHRL